MGLPATCREWIRILQDVGEAFAAVAESGAKPAGVLRVAAPHDFGTSALAGIAADFVRDYPECQVELLLGDERIDLVAHQIDLSIRVGWLEDSSLQARRVGTFQQSLVASPDVAQHITASMPSALASAPFVANSSMRNPLDWQFTRGKQRQALSMRPRLTINSTPAVLAAVLAGGGVGILPDYLVAAPLQAGLLVQLLPDWSLPPGGIHAVFPATRYRPVKTSAFTAFIVRHMAGD